MVPSRIYLLVVVRLQKEFLNLASEIFLLTWIAVVITEAPRIVDEVKGPGETGELLQFILHLKTSEFRSL